MERVLSTEERIRRAEEVYRNKGNVGHEPIKSIPKYKNKLIKKMIIQIVVCLSIYTLFYFLWNTDDLFSKDMVSKAREIMSYDINFDEIYKRFINWLNSNNLFMNKAENEITNSITDELTNEINLNEVLENSASIGGATQEVENTNLSQMEIDAN